MKVHLYVSDKKKGSWQRENKVVVWFVVDFVVLRMGVTVDINTTDITV